MTRRWVGGLYARSRSTTKYSREVSSSKGGTVVSGVVRAEGSCGISPAASCRPLRCGLASVGSVR